jgi:hypothetical protein
VCQKRREFRSKDQLIAAQRVQQRFLADPIARQEKRFVALVPNCQCKHAAQMFWTFGAIFVISVDDRFGIAVSVKSVTQRFQLFAKFAIVINLAVENDPGRAIGIVDRLMAAFEIDNRQPAHRQADSLAEIESIVIGSTMTNRIIHPRE